MPLLQGESWSKETIQQSVSIYVFSIVAAIYLSIHANECFPDHFIFLPLQTINVWTGGNVRTYSTASCSIGYDGSLRGNH